METGKPGLASAPVHINSVAAQTEKRMDIHAPLMAVYIPTVPALPAQHYPPPPAPAGEAATVHLAVPPLYSMETLPFLTLHIAGGLQSQSGLSLAGVSSFSARPKSAGKHVCHHCGRDCMKPSVLEKHLRCHTGERPYPCTTCGISFKTQSNLYKHKRTQAHARLSSESDQSCVGSLDSLCSSSLSLEESNNMEKATSVPSAEITPSARISKIYSPKTHFSQQKLNSSDQESKEPKENETMVGEEQRMRNEKHLLNAGRHLPLQRQEATLFSKQWDNSASRGKSQSHESTDSGFSESSDLQTSPGSALPDHGGDSLTESNKVDPETANTQTPSEPCQVGQEPKHTARDPEPKSLVERISKLISENTAVVEDKQLETVRPRKSVLSKQGSIDLPMPYTYKDSFHFDMRINKTQNFGLQRNRKAGHYSSVPTQQSTSAEPAPLIRSNSLPFSAPLLPSERSNPTSTHQSDYLSLIRRRSSGQIKPTGFAIKSTIPVNTHHPLIRQIAVDCNHATDGLYRNSSVEEGCSASSSCDRESADICGEPSNRKFRRKKAQKFAYNKWYMYGGGSFKKLYSTEKGDEGVKKGRKSSTNLDREVVQGLHKRFPDVHKETLAGSGPAVKLTCTKAITCHPVCPPAKLSHVSAEEFYPKIVHLPTSCSSLRRNLSSSALPLPLIGSLVNLKTDSQGRAEDGRLINEEKHTDSSLQLLESHIPSDRKKQKTDKKIIYPLEMETDPSAMTHPPPSVTGSYINLPSRLNHHQLTGVLLPPCVISANIPTTSISTLSATSAPSAAKTSFLPKYQLKLPNAGESHPKPPPLIVGKTTITDISSALSSPREEPPLPSSTHTRSQLHLPCTATTLRHPEKSSLSQNTKSSLAVVHRKFATTTVTTTCRKDYQAGLCSTSVQPSKSAGGCASEQLTTNSAPLLINLPATPTLTTGNSQTSAFSQGQLHPLLPVSQRFTRASSSNTPMAPCHIIPFDHTQPAAQNVFHVQTADLQICLQIISDEQLALMAPQIERQAGSDFSQMHAEAGTPEVDLDQPQGSVPTDNNNEDVGSHQRSGHQKEMDRRESTITPSKERVRPQHSEKAESDLLKAVLASDSESAETPGPPQPAHKRCDVNMATETQSVPTDVMAAAASYKSKESRAIQHVLSLSRSAGEHVITDSRVGQGGSEPQTLSSQHKPSRTGLPTSVVNQESKRREVQEDELKNQGSTLNADTMTAEGEASAQNSNELESGVSHPPPQSGIGQTFSEPSSDEGSGSVASYSISERQFHPQASIYRCDPVETSKHVKMVTPMNNSSPPLETTPSESHEVFSSAPSEKQLVQFTSVSSNVQVERSEDIPAELTSSPIITAGFMEGHSLSGCAAQKGAQTREHGGTPAPSDCRDWRPVLSREAGTLNHQCREGEAEGEVDGDMEMKSRGIKTDEEPGQRCKDPNSRITCLQEVTPLEGEEGEGGMDPRRNPRFPGQRLSSTPAEHPQRGPDASSNLHSPATLNQAGPFNPPQASVEINNWCFSELWENSLMQDQQTRIVCDSSCSRHIKARTRSTEGQHDSSQMESSPRQAPTFLKPDQNQMSKQSCVAPVTSVQKRSTAMAPSCCAKGKLTLASLSPDVETSSSANPGQVNYSVAVGIEDSNGLSWDDQAPNSILMDSLLPSQNFSYSDTTDYHAGKEEASSDGSSPHGNVVKTDLANKYQSFFFSGQIHGYGPAECLTSGVRPVQSCQDHTEDTSSSDDEGKLIIEL